jgi:hypothetical protein
MTGKLKTIAATLEAPVIEKVLMHLGLQAHAQCHPPARGLTLPNGDRQATPPERRFLVALSMLTRSQPPAATPKDRLKPIGCRVRVPWERKKGACEDRPTR